MVPVQQSDPFHAEYRELTIGEQQAIHEIKTKAAELWSDLALPPDKTTGGREMALAKTNLEQAVMWAVKAITS